MTIQAKSMTIQAKSMTIQANKEMFLSDKGLILPFVLLISLVLSLFLIKTAELNIEPHDDIGESGNMYRLGVHENLYDYIKDNMGTVVLFLGTWCDESKKIKNLLNEKADRNIVVVDDRHPDSTLVDSFPGIYIYNGKRLEKSSLKDITDRT